MSNSNASKRAELVRHAIVFQLKLMADGLRDLVLIPVSLFAAVIGFARGGDEPERELQQVIELGRQSEVWINLFSNHDANEATSEDAHMGTSIDVVFTKIEEVLKQQYQAHGTSQSSQAEIDKALQMVHDQANDQAHDDP